MSTESKVIPSVGVDVGGTFTDIVMFDQGGLRVLKVPTSTDPSTAVTKGLNRLRANATGLSFFSHATTLATNALLTRSGLARTALVTNEGFRDILEIGRQRRPEPYDLGTRRPPPLVERKDRLTVRCRIAANGSVIEKLDQEGARRVARTITRRRFHSVAVSFLNSYLNPAHELRFRDILLGEGFRGHISLSSEVDREYREYERTSTTVVNACLAPLMSHYLSALAVSLRRMRIMIPLYVMNSSGDMSTGEFVAKRPFSSIESGPAAGVVASRHLARRLSLDKVLTFDMGGTTAKAGAVIGGESEVTEEFEAAGRIHSGRSIRGSGYPVRGTFVDLAEVSAGGGTVAWLDEADQLHVGPRSSGSIPGPACYGLGGTEPTVTDANVILGRMSQSHLLGGEMKISRDLSEGAFEKITRPQGIGVEDAAKGVVRLVDHAMAGAISIVSVERGRDPRDFVLIAFGGAGPIHACDLAEELGMRSIIVPAHAGLFSAFGLLVGDLTRTFTDPVMGRARNLKPKFERLEALATREMRADGYRKQTFRRSVEVRYVGQSHEILLPYSSDSDLRSRFDSRHGELYGYSSTDPVEVVNIRVSATVRREGIPRLSSRADSKERGVSRRTAWLGGKRALVPVLRRERLATGDVGSGPDIIEDYDSTLVVNPGWTWRAEEYGLRLSR